MEGKPARKRGREAPSSGLSRLIEQLKRLKIPSISAEEANELLRPLVLDCLKLCNDSSLPDILWNYGWQGDAFTTVVNLFGLSTALSKYRWVRVQELGSGSYAVVYKAKNRETDEIIALKKLRFGFDDQGLPSSTLREISLLKELKHENIVELKDVIFGFGSSSVYVVLECLDCDLRDLLDRDDTAVDLRQVKSYMHQILSAVHHAHMHCVMHRDLKPQNVLVDLSSGRVKVADFGLARSFLPPHKAYTDKVVTLWYRAPELLLGSRTYSPAIDMWSVGCIFAELVNREPLFRAESEIGLLHRVFEALGTPDEDAWAGVGQLANYRTNFPQWKHKGWSTLVPRLAADRLGMDLLGSMLAYDPARRITAGQALAHPWFDDLRPMTPAQPTGTPAAAPRSVARDVAPSTSQQQQHVPAAVAPVERPQQAASSGIQQQQQQPVQLPFDAQPYNVQPAWHQHQQQQQQHQQQQQQPALSVWVPQQQPQQQQPISAPMHHHRQSQQLQHTHVQPVAPIYSHSDQQHKLLRLAAAGGTVQVGAGGSGSSRCAGVGSSGVTTEPPALCQVPPVSGASPSSWVPQLAPGSRIELQPVPPPVMMVPQQQHQHPYAASALGTATAAPHVPRGRPPLPPASTRLQPAPVVAAPVPQNP